MVDTVVCSYPRCWHTATFPIGEAHNPGPNPSGDGPPIFTTNPDHLVVGTINPTQVLGKETIIAELGSGIWLCSETSHTEVARQVSTCRFKKFGISGVWSCDNEPICQQQGLSGVGPLELAFSRISHTWHHTITSPMKCGVLVVLLCSWDRIPGCSQFPCMGLHIMVPTVTHKLPCLLFCVKRWREGWHSKVQLSLQGI